MRMNLKKLFICTLLYTAIFLNMSPAIADWDFRQEGSAAAEYIIKMKRNPVWDETEKQLISRHSINYKGWILENIISKNDKRKKSMSDAFLLIDLMKLDNPTHSDRIKIYSYSVSIYAMSGDLKMAKQKLIEMKKHIQSLNSGDIETTLYPTQKSSIYSSIRTMQTSLSKNGNKWLKGYSKFLLFDVIEWRLRTGTRLKEAYCERALWFETQKDFSASLRDFNYSLVRDGDSDLTVEALAGKFRMLTWLKKYEESAQVGEQLVSLLQEYSQNWDSFEEEKLRTEMLTFSHALLAFVYENLKTCQKANEHNSIACNMGYEDSCSLKCKTD